MAKGQENLIPMSERSEEELREMRKKGGIASGKARRRKRDLKQLLELELSQLDDEGVSRYIKITKAIIKKAESGDTKAYETIRDTLGQKPVEKVEADLKTDIVINVEE